MLVGVKKNELSSMKKYDRCPVRESRDGSSRGTLMRFPSRGSFKGFLQGVPSRGSTSEKSYLRELLKRIP